MNFCHRCQALLEDGRPVCLKCGAPVRRGVLARLGAAFRSLFGSDRKRPLNSDSDSNLSRAPDQPSRGQSPGVKPTWRDAVREVLNAVKPQVHVHRSATIRFEDETTGETGEWSSWNEVPEHIRERILAHGPAHAMIGDLDIRDAEHLAFSDRAAGGRREVASPADLPESVRAMLRDIGVELNSARVVLRGSAAVTHAQGIEQFTVTDAAGRTRTSRRLEDMPPDVRRQFEDIRRRLR